MHMVQVQGTDTVYIYMVQVQGTDTVYIYEYKYTVPVQGTWYNYRV